MSKQVGFHINFFGVIDQSQLNVNPLDLPAPELIEKARKQTLEQLHERRRLVVRLHIKALGVMQIVSRTRLELPGSTGLHRPV
jgi:hypothetical protein